MGLGQLSAQVNWTNAGGGNFSTGSNWSGGSVPNSTQDAVFDEPGANLGVTFVTPAITRRLSIGDGEFTFNLGGNTYSLIESNPLAIAFSMGLASGETGRLTLLDGTLATTIGSVGLNSGTSSNLTLGAGGRLTVSQFINVGMGGSGTVLVNNGASFASDNLILGNFSTGFGTFLVDGSTASASTSIGQFGINGGSQVSIRSGGTLNTANNTSFAANPSSNSFFEVVGTTSTWNHSGGTLATGVGASQFVIGGSLNAHDTNMILSATSAMLVGGGRVNLTGLSNSGLMTSGTLTVNGGGSIDISSDAGLTIQSSGSLELNAGRLTTTNFGLLGGLSFRAGEITLDGGQFSRNGSFSLGGQTGDVIFSLINGAQTSGLTSLVVGNTSGSFRDEYNVLSGSQLSTTALSTIGQTGSNSVVRISGSGSMWNAGNAVSVGDAGEGLLVVENGGRLSTNGNSLLTGVSGAGGVGNLVVQSGGSVEAGSIELARIAGSVSNASFSGAGTLVNATNLIVGGSASNEGGTANLTIDSGAEINISGALRARNLGVININGGNVTTQNFFRSPNGTLNFRDGELRVLGTFLNGSGDVSLIGTALNDNPHLVLAGSAITSGISNMNVGSSNRMGTLTLLANAQLTTGALNIGNLGNVNLDGGRLLISSLNGGGNFDWARGTVDFSSSTSLNNAALSSLLGSSHNLGENRSLGSMGGSLTLDGFLNVQGGTLSPSNLINNSSLSVSQGQIVTNTLTNNAGRMMLVSGNSIVTATAALNNSGTFRMDSPTAAVFGGTLTNNLGGTISGTGQINNNLDNFGTVRVTGSEHLVFTGSDIRNLLNINLSGGTLEFTQSLVNRSGAAITGRGTLITSSSAPGGTGLVNDGLLSFSAGTTDIHGDVEQISGGRIVSSGNAVTTFFDDVVHNGAEIRTFGGSTTVFLGEQSGAGSFTGAGVVEYAGDLRPGNSPASISYEGDVIFNSSVRSFFELGGINLGQFDQLLVDGDFHVDGTLNVDLIGGHSLGTGEFYQIADVGGTFTGQFIGLGEGDLVGSYGGRDLFITYSGGRNGGIGLFTAVPEPSSGTLFLAMISCVAFVRRSRP